MGSWVVADFKKRKIHFLKLTTTQLPNYPLRPSTRVESFQKSVPGGCRGNATSMLNGGCNQCRLQSTCQHHLTSTLETASLNNYRSPQRIFISENFRRGVIVLTSEFRSASTLGLRVCSRAQISPWNSERETESRLNTKMGCVSACR